MSLTEHERRSPHPEPTVEAAGYGIIAAANGQKLVLFQEFGSYQGEWLMLALGESDYFVYSGSYGSCDYCDPYQGTSFDVVDGRIPLSDAKKFAEDYPSFIEIPRATMREVVRTPGRLLQLLPGNMRREYGVGDESVESFAADAAIAAKLEEDVDVTAADIVACKNQEIKQRALRRYGYEAFVRDAGMETVDAVGEEKLLRKGDVVFAYVKDPSTSRRYLLRVPPNMKKLREAVAWTFGMRPEDYRPLVET